MKAIAGLLILQMMTQILPAQDKTGWWEVSDWGLSYELPETWASDPFSSSSVCDCPGTINDNGEWVEGKYIGMVIYPVSEEERMDENRQAVWGYGFVPGENVADADFAGISYKTTYGTFLGMKGQPKVWQLVSNDQVNNKYRDLIIYFWSEEGIFDENIADFEAILQTFKRTKVKR